MSYFLTHLSCIAIQRMKTADATKDHTFKTLGFFNFDTDTAMLPGIGIILCDERIFTDFAYIQLQCGDNLFKQPSINIVYS